jgi:hypothetical protein
MSRNTVRSILVAAALVSVGCYSQTPPASGWKSLGAGNEVSRTELAAAGGKSLYEALMRARRQYFNTRGPSLPTNAPQDAFLVFHEGMLMGTIDILHTMHPSEVRLVRRISAVETYRKYGRVVSGGGFELELANTIASGERAR